MPQLANDHGDAGLLFHDVAPSTDCAQPGTFRLYGECGTRNKCESQRYQDVASTSQMTSLEDDRNVSGTNAGEAEARHRTGIHTQKRDIAETLCGALKPRQSSCWISHQTHHSEADDKSIVSASSSFTAVGSGASPFSGESRLS